MVGSDDILNEVSVFITVRDREDLEREEGKELLVNLQN